MPRLVDVDAQAAEGATIYTIGGRMWYAAEPSLDTFKEVLAAAPDGTSKVDAEGKPIAPTREETNTSLDSMLPQLQLLLVEWDKETNTATAAVPDAEFLQKNLSVKRAGTILREILGEGEGVTAPA